MIQLWSILLIALLSAIVVSVLFLVHNRKEMRRRLKIPRVYIKLGVMVDGKSIHDVLSKWGVRLTNNRASARFIIEFIIKDNKKAVGLGIWSSSDQLLVKVSFSDGRYRIKKIPFLLFRAMCIAKDSMKRGKGKKYAL